MDMTESTVRVMLTAIEAPLYDVGVLSERGMLSAVSLGPDRGAPNHPSPTRSTIQGRNYQL